MPGRMLKGHAIVHLIDRALEGKPVLRKPAFKAAMMRFLREGALRFGVDVHAYVLMDNHMHTLASGRMNVISKMMQSLKHRFVSAYNRAENRRGPLFEGRFQSHRIRTFEYALDRSYYVHLNPVKAGLAARPERYRWSSAAAYVGVAPSPTWLRPVPLWSLLARQAHEAKAQYADAMAQFARTMNGGYDMDDESSRSA